MKHAVWLVTVGILAILLYLSFNLIREQQLVKLLPGEQTETPVSEEYSATPGDVVVRYEQYQYDWDELSIVISTDAGYYSEHLNNVLETTGGINGLSKAELSDMATVHFVGSSYLESLIQLELPGLLEEYGFGHALPIIAMVAIENVQKPIPTFLGHQEVVESAEFNEVVSGRIDPSIPGEIRITVHTNRALFDRVRAGEAYPYSRAYFDPQANELSLFLDMESFRNYYGFLEQEQGMEHLLAPAFITFVATTFNDDSGHEIAHFFQDQSSDPAYQIPAISEGEALVNGFISRRHGLRHTLIYNTSDMWFQGQRDLDAFAKRIQIISRVGNPMCPFEVDRIKELRELAAEEALIPVGDLLRLDSDQFYLGSETEVRKRYLESWALFLMAIRDEEAQSLLMEAIAARIENTGESEDFTSRLDEKLVTFLEDPQGLKVTLDVLWNDAESAYKFDENLAGMIYQWVYLADPTDYLPLVYLGDSLYQEMRYDLAIRYYRKAHAIAPDEPIPIARIGDVYYEIHDYEKARPLYLEALDKGVHTESDSINADYTRRRLQEIDKELD